MMGHPRGDMICKELTAAGVRHIAWLPDSESVFMHEPLRDSGLSITQVCREGEAVAICGGLALAGELGALLVENQGLFDSGNILKWARNTELPMVLLVSWVFYSRMRRTERGMEANGQLDYTERFLDAFDVPHAIIDTDEAVVEVGRAAARAREERRPVAVLLASADHFQPGM